MSVLYKHNYAWEGVCNRDCIVVLVDILGNERPGFTGGLVH